MLDVIEQVRKLLVEKNLIDDKKTSIGQEKSNASMMLAVFSSEPSESPTELAWGRFYFRNSNAKLSAIKGAGIGSTPGTAEIAFFKGSEFDTTFEEEWGDTVLGYQNPQEILEWCEKWIERNA